jgi:hypothetical protein
MLQSPKRLPGFLTANHAGSPAIFANTRTSKGVSLDAKLDRGQFGATCHPNHSTNNSPATQQALARGPVGNAFEGFTQLGSKEGIKNLGGKLGYAGVAGLAAPLLSSALEPLHL